MNSANNDASNTETNDTDVDTDVDTNVETNVNVDVGLDGWEPTDDDFADIDMTGGSIDNLLINEGGDLSFDPGNDVTMSDILNNSLTGGASNTANVFAQTSHLVDNVLYRGNRTRPAVCARLRA